MINLAPAEVTISFRQIVCLRRLLRASSGASFQPQCLRVCAIFHKMSHLFRFMHIYLLKRAIIQNTIMLPLCGFQLGTCQMYLHPARPKTAHTAAGLYVPFFYLLECLKAA